MPPGAIHHDKRPLREATETTIKRTRIMTVIESVKGIGNETETVIANGIATVTATSARGIVDTITTLTDSQRTETRVTEIHETRAIPGKHITEEGTESTEIPVIETCGIQETYENQEIYETQEIYAIREMYETQETCAIRETCAAPETYAAPEICETPAI
jgi:hypothetical protein